MTSPRPTAPAARAARRPYALGLAGQGDVMGELDGKVAVVTGAASGIGLACASRLVAEGARVVAVDIAEDPLRRMADALGAVAVRADVSRPDDWAAVVDAVRGLGGVDYVYLNAGVTTQEGDITSLTDDQYRRIMAVNVDGVVFGARALVPELVARGGGALVATASLAGLVAFAADPIYALTKHAVVGLVRGLALTLVDQGITVNAVCPGNDRHPARRRRPRGAGRRAVPPDRPRGGRRSRTRMHGRRCHRSGRRRPGRTRALTVSLFPPSGAAPGRGRRKGPTRFAGRAHRHLSPAASAAACGRRRRTTGDRRRPDRSTRWR